MLKSHYTENELISTFEDTEKMLYVVCLIKSYRMLNSAIDLPKSIGNFEHRQEYISRILQHDHFTQYAFPRLHQLQISKKSTLVPEVYFYYFHCEGERKNKPLEPG